MNSDVAFLSKAASDGLFDNRIAEWLSTQEAARFLRISENALRICVYRGQIKVYRFGRRLRFRVEDLRQILQKGGI